MAEVRLGASCVIKRDIVLWMSKIARWLAARLYYEPVANVALFPPYCVIHSGHEAQKLCV